MLLVVLASFIGSFGSVLLKSGSGRLHKGIRHLVFNERLAAGVALYVISAVFFFLGLRKGELSVLYPMVSLGYIWTVLWSRLFFGEPFTRNKFVSLFLIVMGVAFLGFSGR
jgi:multidrug transporter EmrE-like cation transporter